MPFTSGGDALGGAGRRLKTRLQACGYEARLTRAVTVGEGDSAVRRLASREAL
jgi:hypothetical protein